jgi:hypothetical protein
MTTAGLIAGLGVFTLIGITHAEEPVQVKTVPEIVFDRNAMIPRLVNNHLIVSKYYCESAGCSVVKLLDLQNRTWREFNPWPSEPTAGVVIKKVVPLRDGRIVVGLRCISFDNQRAEIVAVFDKSGKRTGWFRTNPFAWDDFALDNDNSIWVFGFCPDYLTNSCSTDYGTVRHYSLEGDMLHAFLPYDTFPKASLLGARSGVMYTYVFVGSKGIGVYVDPTGEWIQLDRKGTIVSRERLALPEAGDSFRLGMSPSGRVFLWGNGLAGLREWNSQKKAFENVPGANGNLFFCVEGGTIVMGELRLDGKPLLLKYYDVQ